MWMDRCVGMQMWMCWMWLVVDTDEYKGKRRKRKQKIYWIVDVDGCGPKNADDLC